MLVIRLNNDKKVSLNKFLGVTEFTLAGFHIFQHGIKGAVHHDCTTVPFHRYQKIADNRHESSRDSCRKVQLLIFAFLLQKNADQQIKAGQLCGLQDYRLNTISAFNLWSIEFPVAFNDLEGLQPRVQNRS